MINAFIKSLSISGGKETSQDSLSSREQIGMSPTCKLLNCSLKMRSLQERKACNGTTTVVLSISNDNKVGVSCIETPITCNETLQCYKCWRILRDILRLCRLIVLCTMQSESSMLNSHARQQRVKRIACIMSVHKALHVCKMFTLPYLMRSSRHGSFPQSQDS